MIPVFYPLGTGSMMNNFELRMSLRSIEKHLSNYIDVIIVGELPEWVQNVTYFQLEDIAGEKDFNIMRKTERALQEVEKLLFFNDDHYLLQDFDAENFPYFYHDTIENYVRRRGMDGYGRRANNTMKHLKSKNLPIKFFDIHTPIIYERQPFIENVVNLDWKKYKEGFVIKSLYSNALKIEGTEQRDYKSKNPPVHPINIFSSTNAKPRASVQRFLLERFPNKSKYER